MTNRIFRTLVLALGLMATAACKHDPVPENLIDTATLTRFLTENYIVNGYDYVVVSQNRDSLSYQTQAATEALFNKYGFTPADYDSSIAYYAKRPKTVEDIFNRTIEALKKIESEAREKKD